MVGQPMEDKCIIDVTTSEGVWANEEQRWTDPIFASYCPSNACSFFYFLRWQNFKEEINEEC
jgi:hypothetical protein